METSYSFTSKYRQNHTYMCGKEYRNMQYLSIGTIIPMYIQRNKDLDVSNHISIYPNTQRYIWMDPYRNVEIKICVKYKKGLWYARWITF